MSGEIAIRFTLGGEEPIDLIVDVEPKLGALTKVQIGDHTGIWIGGTYVGEVRLPIVLEVAP